MDLPVIERPSSRLSLGDSAVMRQMQKDVTDIKKAVTTILNTLIVQEEVVVESVEDFIPEKIKNQEMMNQLNEQLESDEEFRKKLIMVLAKLKDGGDLPSITRLLMRSMLTNGIMSKYSLTSQRGKTPFKGTRTCKVILRALKRATKNRFPVKDYEFEIAEVLRNAPNCPGGVNFLKTQEDFSSGDDDDSQSVFAVNEEN
ncbi:unnamed protein product [Mytilus coruscus]|uniref:Uncharacterized protein n=1 Tax=Mytilus coruscus TaxID=42192 RepID=A0A6J8EL21_MYTCO|nr:unnamed protein product [Mytilus coruscus]